MVAGRGGPLVRSTPPPLALHPDPPDLTPTPFARSPAPAFNSVMLGFTLFAPHQIHRDAVGIPMACQSNAVADIDRRRTPPMRTASSRIPPDYQTRRLSIQQGPPTPRPSALPPSTLPCPASHLMVIPPLPFYWFSTSPTTNPRTQSGAQRLRQRTSCCGRQTSNTDGGATAAASELGLLHASQNPRRYLASCVCVRICRLMYQC